MSERPWQEARRQAERFVERLQALGRGELAVFRRSAGERLATARNALGLFYRLLPPEPQFPEETFFLVATLFPLNGHKPVDGDFGRTMAVLRQRTNREGLDSRMRILLEADYDRRRGTGELPYRLRQAVKLADSQQVGVDWVQLLLDLNWWGHPDRIVQKRWARSYFHGDVASQEPQAVAAEGGQ